MKLVFLLEEKSMKRFLDIILPKILPKEILFQTIPHEGKRDLEISIPRKLKAWNEPDVKFIIIQDQDSWNCVELKHKLVGLCKEANKTFLVRIACHELESWYFGDLQAVSKAYNKDLTKIAQKSQYKIPDKIVNPKNELLKYLPEHQQILGAEKIAEYFEPQINTSVSFQMLLSGVKKLITNKEDD
ncbi:MAG: DUF4276 family protein [Treponema sp.]